MKAISHPEATFRTIVPVDLSEIKITKKQPTVWLGSCFADLMGSRLVAGRCDALVNPGGILYDPISLANLVNLALHDRQVCKEDFLNFQGLWHSFRFHGDLSHASLEQAIEKANQRLLALKRYLTSASHLFLTLGTAIVFEFGGEIVANCHKLPARDFTTRTLEINEIVASLDQLLNALLTANPKLRVVATVSPVRHWRNGAIANQHSKALLLVALHTLRQSNTALSYFPAYEIMMDELRDYRFYTEDMLHPSSVAADYIWTRLEQAYLDSHCSEILRISGQISRAKNHRILNPGTPAHLQFLQDQIKKIEGYRSSHPNVDWSDDLDYFAGEWQRWSHVQENNRP